MTITTHDCFAVFPKRCDKCNRLFWLEPYDIYYKEVGIEHYPIRHIKCSKHWSKDDGREMKVSERIEQLQTEITKLAEKYCDYCQEYSCEDCVIEYKMEEEV